MYKYIKVKNTTEHETNYIPKNKISWIRTDVEYDTCINNKSLEEWFITFYFEDPEVGQPHTFFFDTKEKIQEILRQLED